MASISITEKDFTTLFEVIMDLQDSDPETAEILDQMALRANVALTNAKRPKGCARVEACDVKSPLESLKQTSEKGDS